MTTTANKITRTFTCVALRYALDARWFVDFAERFGGDGASTDVTLEFVILIN